MNGNTHVRPVCLLCCGTEIGVESMFAEAFAQASSIVLKLDVGSVQQKDVHLKGPGYTSHKA